MKTHIIRWALVLCAFVLPISSLLAQGAGAQLPALPALVVDLSLTQAVVASANDNIFPLVGVQPGQTVQVTVQYPASEALQIVQVTALDGGTVAFPPGGTTINSQGTITFAFTAAQTPGLNQVSLQQGSTELGVEFWVLDSQNPQNNPPTATPITLGGEPL